MAVITISRQFGAGGKTLGTRIAKETGYILIDDEIIERVAKEAKVTPTWVKSLESDEGGWLTKFITGTGPFRVGYADPTAVRQGFIDGHIYVELLHKVIAKIADEGNCVIIGRGGQYVLHDREDTLHLLMVAEEKDRVEFMQDTYKLSKANASKIVEKMDHRRNNLFRYYGKDDYDDPYMYDLSLNMSRIDMDTATGIVLKLLSSRQMI